MSLTVRLLAILALAVSCGSDGSDLKIPADIIVKDSMVGVLTDMHLIEGAKTGNKIMGDSLTADFYYAKMYKKHGITKEQFEQSFEFYSKHPEMMKSLYTQVIERLNTIQQEPPRTPLTDQTEAPSRAPTDSSSVRFLSRKMRFLDSLPKGPGTDSIK